MNSDFGLTVRRHERHQLSLGALFSLGALQPGASLPGAGALRFSAESGVSESGAHAIVVDLGVGGMGIRTALFIPRGAVLRVRILGAAGEVARPRLDTLVRVQRVTMIDRKPTYLLGTSFVDSSPALSKAVTELVAAISAPSDATEAA